MNRQASILFNISSSISGNWLAQQESTAPHSYYQRLIYTLLSRSVCTTEGFQFLGRQLAGIAHHAYFQRQIEAVDQASQMMLALPTSRDLKGIAHYYQAICAKRQGDFEGARELLERAVEEASPQYRAKALLTIGATHFDGGEVEAARDTAAHLVELFFVFSHERYIGLKMYQFRLRRSRQAANQR